MNLPSILGHGEPEPPQPDQVQRQRVVSARANSRWVEVDPETLERHGRHFRVRQETDEVFTPYDGAVWNALGGIEFAATSPLFFTVEDGRVRLLELYPRSWSEISAAGTR